MVLLILLRELIIVDHENIISILVDSYGDLLEGLVIYALIGRHRALACSILLLLVEICLSNDRLNLFALHFEEVGGAAKQIPVI